MGRYCSKKGFSSPEDMEEAIVDLVGLEKFKPDFKRTAVFFDRYRKFVETSILVTIGGTNGKGETCLFLEHLLEKEGLRTALYTSPHILQFTERIRVGAKEASVQSLQEGFETLKQYRHLSYFEFLLALFFERLQRERGLDVIILEVGLGGRLDCVNVFDADIAAITGISRDHTGILGKTYRSILREKFGITRLGRPLVTALESNYLQVLAKKMSQVGHVAHTDLFDIGVLSRKDNFRVRNQVLAMALKEYLVKKEIPGKSHLISFKKKLKPESFSLLGRFQKVIIKEKEFIFVGAHNVDGIRKLCHYSIKAYNNRKKSMDVLISFSKRPLKEIEQCLKILNAQAMFFDDLYLSSFCHPRAFEKEDTIKLVNVVPTCQYVESWKDFLESHDKSKTIMVLGSLYFIAEILKYFQSSSDLRN